MNKKLLKLKQNHKLIPKKDPLSLLIDALWH